MKGMSIKEVDYSIETKLKNAFQEAHKPWTFA